MYIQGEDKSSVVGSAVQVEGVGRIRCERLSASPRIRRRCKNDYKPNKEKKIIAVLNPKTLFIPPHPPPAGQNLFPLVLSIRFTTNQTKHNHSHIKALAFSLLGTVFLCRVVRRQWLLLPPPLLSSPGQLLRTLLSFLGFPVSSWILLVVGFDGCFVVGGRVISVVFVVSTGSFDCWVFYQGLWRRWSAGSGR